MTQNKYLDCPYYCSKRRKENRCYIHPVIPGLSDCSTEAECDRGDITTCIYLDKPKIKELIKAIKDRALRDQEQIEEFLLRIANTFGEPYR